MVRRLLLVWGVGLLFGCSDNNEITFHALNLNNPCIVSNYQDAILGTLCAESIVTRNEDGLVIGITEDCHQHSFEFDYDESGNLTLHRLYSNGNLISVNEYEYDQSNTLLRWNDNTYHYTEDSIIVLNPSGERVGLFWNLNEFGKPGNYTSVSSDGFYTSSRIYEYDEEGNIVKVTSNNSLQGTKAIIYAYNYEYANPDPIQSIDPFRPTPKYAPISITLLGTSIGNFTNLYEYEWNSNENTLSVIESTEYEGQPQLGNTQLFRLYYMICN